MPNAFDAIEQALAVCFVAATAAALAADLYTRGRCDGLALGAEKLRQMREELANG